MEGTEEGMYIFRYFVSVNGLIREVKPDQLEPVELP